MPITRREFLKQGGLIGAALIGNGCRRLDAAPVGPALDPRTPVCGTLIRRQRAASRERERPALDPNTLARFVDPLPIPAIARSSEFRPSPTDPAVKLPYYRIEMRQFVSKLHRDLKPTRQWGYGAAVPGPTFETRGGQALPADRSQPPRRGVRQAGGPHRRSPSWRLHAARKRWLSRGLVRPGQVDDLPLPESAGRGDALVSRPCDGD